MELPVVTLAFSLSVAEVCRMLQRFLGLSLVAIGVQAQAALIEVTVIGHVTQIEFADDPSQVPAVPGDILTLKYVYDDQTLDAQPLVDAIGEYGVGLVSMTASINGLQYTYSSEFQDSFYAAIDIAQNDWLDGAPYWVTAFALNSDVPPFLPRFANVTFCPLNYDSDGIEGFEPPLTSDSLVPPPKEWTGCFHRWGGEGSGPWGISANTETISVAAVPAPSAIWLVLTALGSIVAHGLKRRMFLT